MIERIIDIGEPGARLTLHTGRLSIERHGEAPAFVPLKEVGVLVCDGMRTSYTQPLLAGLVREGAALVVCDEKHMPSGLMLPLAGNHIQAQRTGKQATASAPLKKRLWQQLVRAKLKGQGRTLETLRDSDYGLRELARRVRSGDPDNLEARGARKYWAALFGSRAFRREPGLGRGLNAKLDYGYAVLRGAVARALVAAGLNPSLGLHHHNRYNAFCLADDLIEPFRPLVDEAVARRSATLKETDTLTREEKQTILEPLTGKYDLDGEKRTLFDLAAKAAQSLAAAYEGRVRKLALPDW